MGRSKLCIVLGVAFLLSLSGRAASQSAAGTCHKGYCYQTDVSNIYKLLEGVCTLTRLTFGGNKTAGQEIFNNGLPEHPNVSSFRERVIYTKPGGMLYQWLYPGYFRNFTADSISATPNWWSTTGRFTDALRANLPYLRNLVLHTLMWDVEGRILFDFLDEAMANPRTAVRNVDRARALWAGRPGAVCYDNMDNVTDNTGVIMGVLLNRSGVVRAGLNWDMTRHFSELQQAASRRDVAAMREKVLSIVRTYVRFGLMFVGRYSYTIDYSINCNNTLSDLGREKIRTGRQSMKDVAHMTLTLAQRLGVPAADLHALRDGVWNNGTIFDPAYQQVWPVVMRIGSRLGFSQADIGTPIISEVAINTAIFPQYCERPPLALIS